MTTLSQMSEKSGLSLRWLKKLDKLGYLNATDSPTPMVDGIRANLKKGNRLTALQQLELWRNQQWIEKHFQQWEYDIQSALSALGNVSENAAPWSISNGIELAARQEPDAVQKIASWLQSTLATMDCSECDHAYIVTRLLANVPEHHLENLAKKAQACMWQVRRLPELQDGWKLNAQGHTIYLQKPLDL